MRLYRGSGRFLLEPPGDAGYSEAVVTIEILIEDSLEFSQLRCIRASGIGSGCYSALFVKAEAQAV